MSIKEIIKKEESGSIERKPSLSQIDEIIETISAFSNTKGGTILIGVTNDGKVKGVEIGKDTVERLSNRIIQNTDPKVHPEISVEEIDKKKIIKIDVKESTDKLVLAFGRPYKRFGKSKVKMSKEEYERLILEKHRDKIQFDNQICEGATLKDIDGERIKWFPRKARAERNFDVSPETPADEILKKLKLIISGKLTNAAILMFGKEPQNLFLQAEVRCARFKGIKPVKPFIDMKVIGGTIYEQIDESEKFVLNNIRKSAWVESGRIERQEKWEYPSEAIREAITNAVAHRDYYSASNVQIRIFDDRIEVWNPGKLPEGWTTETLRQKHESHPKNPLLANGLFLIKYIEQWGTGTNDMIKETIEYGLPEPEFEITPTSIIVTFRKSKLTEEYLESFELNERQRKVIEYIKEHKKIKSGEYAKLFSITERMARNDLNSLIKKGVVKRTGASDKTACYILEEI